MGRKLKWTVRCPNLALFPVVHGSEGTSSSSEWEKSRENYNPASDYRTKEQPSPSHRCGEEAVSELLDCERLLCLVQEFVETLPCCESLLVPPCVPCIHGLHDLPVLPHGLLASHHHLQQYTYLTPGEPRTDCITWSPVVLPSKGVRTSQDEPAAPGGHHSTLFTRAQCRHVSQVG